MSLEESFLEGAGLTFQKDSYGGLTVDVPARVALDAQAFYEAMGAVISQFRDGRRCRGLWLRLPATPEATALVAPAIALGFNAHHARSEYLMFNQWLGEGPSRLPRFANTQVGAAGFVLNSSGEVLVIRERHGPTARLPDFWKRA